MNIRRIALVLLMVAMPWWWAGSAALRANVQRAAQPPQVYIDSPREGEVIIRKGEAPGAPVAAYQPSRYVVEARVVWADGVRRAIESAQLWVDGIQANTAVNPQEDRFQLDWELRDYGSAEGQAVRLQVLVRDVNGLENTSAPIAVVVRLEGVTMIPRGEAAVAGCDRGVMLADWFCLLSNAMGGSMQLMRMVVGLALALAFLWWLRQRKKQTFIQKEEIPPGRSRETITRITTPVSADVAGYLEVVQGDVDMIGKRIVLYQDAKTLAGRSLHEAEIVFNMNSSTSVVSRKHCEFIGRGKTVAVRDLGSTQGTFVNGERLPKGGEGSILQDGDLIELGPADQGGVVLRFSGRNAANSPE